MRGATLVVLLIGLVAAGTGRAQTIYRCVGPAGEAYFTDRDCGNAVPGADPADVLVVPSLTPGQWQAVTALDRRLAERTRSVAARRADHLRAGARAVAVRDRACSAARAGLERVRQIKRRGYAAARAADLQARQRKYRLQMDRHCD